MYSGVPVPDNANVIHGEVNTVQLPSELLYCIANIIIMIILQNNCGILDNFQPIAVVFKPFRKCLFLPSI